MRKKRPAAKQVGIEIDPEVVSRWRAFAPPPCELVQGDAVEWLSTNVLERSALIYADPPYMPCTRKRTRVYRFDYTEADHVRLLNTLIRQPCNIMISGYRSQVYDEFLHGWNRKSFQAKAHDGMREEIVWFNFDPPERLHDVSYLGEGFRDREASRRRRTRLRQRIAGLPFPEQHGLLEWLQNQLGKPA